MRLVTAVRLPVDGEAEAEPVIVDVTDTRVALHLDDGEWISFDLAEFQAAIATDELAAERKAA